MRGSSVTMKNQTDAEEKGGAQRKNEQRNRSLSVSLGPRVPNERDACAEHAHGLCTPCAAIVQSLRKLGARSAQTLRNVCAHETHRSLGVAPAVVLRSRNSRPRTVRKTESEAGCAGFLRGHSSAVTVDTAHARIANAVSHASRFALRSHRIRTHRGPRGRPSADVSRPEAARSLSLSLSLTRGLLVARGCTLRFASLLKV